MPAYRLGTVEVDSEIVLSGLPRTDLSGTSRIVVRRGGAEASAFSWVDYPEGADFTPEWAVVDHLRSVDGAWYRIRYDYRGHVADFSIRHDGREVLADIGEGESDGEVANLIEGPILGRAARLAGSPLLHATALVAKGQAIALMGGSGVGKSSLAWALVQQGCSLVADDMLGLSVDGDKVLSHPGRHRLRMWPDAAKRLSVTGTGAASLFPTAEEWQKVGISDVGVCVDRPVALTAIYRMMPRDPLASGHVVADLPAGRRLAELAANVHGMIAPQRDQRQRELAGLAEVSRRVPVRTLTLPDDLEALPNMAAGLMHRLFDA